MIVFFKGYSRVLPTSLVVFQKKMVLGGSSGNDNYENAFVRSILIRYTYLSSKLWAKRCEIFGT